MKRYPIGDDAKDNQTLWRGRMCEVCGGKLFKIIISGYPDYPEIETQCDKCGQTPYFELYHEGGAN